MTLAEHIEDRSVVAVAADEDETLEVIEVQENLLRNIHVEVTLTSQNDFWEWTTLVIRRYRHLLYGLRDDAVADGGLCPKKRLRLCMLIGAVEKDDVLNLLMTLKEYEELAGIDVPPVLPLRVEHICPVDEDECLAFEHEERSGHVRRIVQRSPSCSKMIATGKTARPTCSIPPTRSEQSAIQ